jgi:hypothetical protein
MIYMFCLRMAGLEDGWMAAQTHIIVSCRAEYFQWGRA